MPDSNYFPLDENEQPKALINVSEEDKIGLDNYGNVTIRASVTRFVKDSDTKDEMVKAHEEIIEVLDQTYIDRRRDAMREELAR